MVCAGHDGTYLEFFVGPIFSKLANICEAHDSFTDGQAHKKRLPNKHRYAPVMRQCTKRNGNKYSDPDSTLVQEYRSTIVQEYNCTVIQ